MSSTDTHISSLQQWWNRHNRFRIWLTLTTGVTLAGAAAVLLVDVPWTAGFTVAVVAAGAWCRWLEQHPQ